MRYESSNFGFLAAVGKVIRKYLSSQGVYFLFGESKNYTRK